MILFLRIKPRRSTLTNPNEKVPVPEALQRLRHEQEQAVNAALVAREGELVLVHWYDMEEHSEASQFGGGLKNKYPYEAECIAVGLTTGHTATSFYRNVRFQHYVWALPVRKMWKLVLSTDMKATAEHPEGQIRGAFPQLPHLWDSKRNQHGNAKFAHFPWSDHLDNPTNLGGSHLSLAKAESLNYPPFCEGEDTHHNRAAQVVIGHDEVVKWIRERLGNYLTNEQVDERLIPDIYRFVGYDWTQQQAA